MCASLKLFVLSWKSLAAIWSLPSTYLISTLSGSSFFGSLACCWRGPLLMFSV
jgi:hypothetical protein